MSKFPTLSLSVISEDNLTGESTVKTFEPNTLHPIPFETTLFKGHLLLLVRPTDDTSTPVSDDERNENEKYVSNYDHIFLGRKRMIEFQIQGVFQRSPTGLLYMGIEITEQMSLGLVTKGLCRMLLNFMQQFSKNLHYSFGEGDFINSNNNDQLEYPHISFPLKDLDRLVVTKQGETPPKLGSVIEESEESIAQRKLMKADQYNEWNTTDVYTLSFNTHYVDLPTWRIVNVPIMKDMNLRTFWGNSLVRLVGYEVIDNVTNEKSNGNGKHEQRYLNYLFCAQVSCILLCIINFVQYLIANLFLDLDGMVQAKYIPEGRETLNAAKTSAELPVLDKTREEATLSWKIARPSVSRSFYLQKLDFGISQPAESPSSPSLRKTTPIDKVDFTIDDDAASSDFYQSEAESSDEETVYFDAQSTEIIRKDFYSDVLNNDVAPYPPNNLCPAWIDFYESGHYTRLFAVSLPSGEFLILSSANFYSCFGGKIIVPSMVTNQSSPRVSHSERLRRRLGHILSMAFLALAPDALEECLKKLRNASSSYRYMKRLRSESEASLKKSGKKSAPRGVLFQGFLARAASESHWVEQWAAVTSSHVWFYQPDKKRLTYCISLQSVLNIKSSSRTEGYEFDSPCIPQFYFSALETLGRTIYCMHATSIQCTQWIVSISTALQDIRGYPNLHEQVDDAWQTIVHTPDDPAQEFLHCSSIWSCKGRRVLNCKKYLFNYDKKPMKETPCRFSEQLLQKALTLNSKSSHKSLCSFLDSASLLKAVDVSMLEEPDRKAFFINLYHIMIMHAFVVLGPPRSSFEWISYFNMISYQCSDDIFSLAELEHRIIRAGMSSPSHFISKFVLPRTQYSFALTKPDFRINFALNCGSISNPSSVPIYNVENLNEQLNYATELYLATSVGTENVGRKGIVLTLPRVCQWYEGDFGKHHSRIIQTLYPFFPEKVRAVISPLLEDHQHKSIIVKFSSYNYECSFLTLSEVPKVKNSH